MSMCKIICVCDSSNCLAYADEIWVYSQYTAVVSEFLDFLRDVTLFLGYSLENTRGKKGLGNYLLQLVRQWFCVTEHYEMRSKCYVMG